MTIHQTGRWSLCT